MNKINSPLLKLWVLGNPLPLNLSFSAGEWPPCGRPTGILYRAVVTNYVDIYFNNNRLESWSKSKNGTLLFVRKEYGSCSEDKKVFLYQKEIISNDQIIDVSQTTENELYRDEQEVICKAQNLKEATLLAVYLLRKGSFSKIS